MTNPCLRRTDSRLASFRWAAALAWTATACVAAFGQETSSGRVASEENAPGETFPIPAEAKSYDELMEFVKEIDSREPTGDGEEEMIAHQRKVARTVVAVARQALQLELEDQQAMQMAYFQLQALRILGELGEPEVDKQLAKAIEVVRRDERADVAAVGMKFFVESGFREWSRLGENEQSALVNQIVEYVKACEANGRNLHLLMTVVDRLGDMDGNDFAKLMLAELLPHYEENADPRLQADVERMVGVSRRLNLPGNKMELQGKLLDGAELDWASYRGKVVLVDFWATWCGPCRVEVSNVLKMYDAYHKKGFDVLGISLDLNATQAESYIKQHGIPWATLFSDDESQRRWEHPMAVKYGITGIPRAILVDREGTVVSMNARGPILVRELRRLLGEPLAKSGPLDDPSIHQVAKPVVEP